MAFAAFIFFFCIYLICESRDRRKIWQKQQDYENSHLKFPNAVLEYQYACEEYRKIDDLQKQANIPDFRVDFDAHVKAINEFCDKYLDGLSFDSAAVYRARKRLIEEGITPMYGAGSRMDKAAIENYLSPAKRLGNCFHDYRLAREPIPEEVERLSHFIV